MSVRYDAPARNCRRVLRILPLERPGVQITTEEWRCSPAPDYSRELEDSWGNRRLLLVHKYIPQEVNLELLIAARSCDLPLAADTNMSSRGLGALLLASSLADLGPEVWQTAQKIRGDLKGTELLQALGAWTHQRLTYNPNPEARPRPASRMLAESSGSCQDLAHVLTALCRACGMPARYVAGYAPGQGLLHAWVEALIDGTWHPYDPTHGRSPLPGSVVVGTGRDHNDVRAVSGSFFGGNARLLFSCRTEVEGEFSATP